MYVMHGKLYSMNKASHLPVCNHCTSEKQLMSRINVRRYLCDESILSFRFVGQQTAEHMDLFPVQTSSCTLPLGERKRKWGGGCMVSQYSTSA